ncbi:glycoside hydrolase family 16 protein [Paractinoplanes durhamensis]|uniref:glycoside hydrolase family 16 protein n=1 Tax=Paractinoplanes durhamensis TaxID=113563 RepID=UPI003629470B
MVQDFNGSSLPAQWGTYDSPNGTPPRSGDMVSVSNGMLHIAGGVNSRVGKDVGGGVMYLKAQKYGRWEVRFRAQAGAGYGAFVLLWPQNNEDWPTVGEIDLAEVVASDRSTFGTFLHHGSANHQVGLDATKADFTEFHTVAVEWLPTRVTYYLDGKKFFNVTPSQIETGLPTESAMNLAMQLDQGCGGYIACRNGSTPPGSLWTSTGCGSIRRPDTSARDLRPAVPWTAGRNLRFVDQHESRVSSDSWQRAPDHLRCTGT